MLLFSYILDLLFRPARLARYIGNQLFFKTKNFVIHNGAEGGVDSM